MIRVILLVTFIVLAMLLPYLPGRFDSSAATFSLLAQVASYTSLLFVPVGLAWLMRRRQYRLWWRLTLAVAGLVAFVTAIAGVATNQLTLGVIVGTCGLSFVWRAHRQSNPERINDRKSLVPIYLIVVPIVLVTLRSTVVTRAAEWSRDRAIQHSAVLIAAVEAFRERNGQYPISLHSLNHDVPTGVVGIERFLYEPNGAAFNLFFIRPSIQMDAMEVVMFNQLDEHRFTSHELDILQFDGEQLNVRRGDRRRTPLAHPHWISILFD